MMSSEQNICVRIYSCPCIACFLRLDSLWTASDEVRWAENCCAPTDIRTPRHKIFDRYIHYKDSKPFLFLFFLGCKAVRAWKEIRRKRERKRNDKFHEWESDQNLPVRDRGQCHCCRAHFSHQGSGLIEELVAQYMGTKKFQIWSS